MSRDAEPAGSFGCDVVCNSGTCDRRRVTLAPHEGGGWDFTVFRVCDDYDDDTDYAAFDEDPSAFLTKEELRGAAITYAVAEDTTVGVEMGVLLNGVTSVRTADAAWPVTDAHCAFVAGDAILLFVPPEPIAALQVTQDDSDTVVALTASSAFGVYPATAVVSRAAYAEEIERQPAQSAHASWNAVASAIERQVAAGELEDDTPMAMVNLAEEEGEDGEGLA